MTAVRAVPAPPHDLEAEEAVLGACLISGHRADQILDPVSPDDFYNPRNQKIATSIRTLIDQQHPIDLVTVTDQLRTVGHLDEVGGPAYLSTLLTSTPTSAHAEHYARIVAKLSTRRLLQDALLDAQRNVEHEELDSILDRLEASLLTTRRMSSAEAPLPTSFLDWTPFWDTDHREAEWLFEDVLARGRAHVLYADAKAGKSLLCLYMALKIVEAGSVCIYLDYEQTEDDLHERLSDMGAGPEADLSRLRYALLPSLPPLDTADGGRAVAQLIDDTETRFPGRHIMVVVDTTSRAVEGEENSADTIRAFYRHTGLLLKQRGVTWIRLDHAGKDGGKGQRGSSAKRDDIDVVWKLNVDEGGYTLKREAARMGWVPEKVALARRDEPTLRFVRVSQGWPAGTKEAAEILERLNVPVDISFRRARELLREAQCHMRNDRLTAALKWRRENGATDA